MSRSALGLGVAAALAVAGCDFDGAYRDFCRDNPGCDEPDAGGHDAGGTDGGSPDAGAWPSPQTCEHQGDCPAGQFCHPAGHVCLQTCQTAAGCAAGLDVCAPLPGAGPEAPLVCTCSTAQSCALALPGTTCSPLDNLCEKLCTTASDCLGFDPPRVCDTLSGLCLAGPAGCTENADCPSAAQPRCDLGLGRCTKCFAPDDCAHRTDGLNDCVTATGACAAFAACDRDDPRPGVNHGPDTCRYGQVCVGSLCAPVARGTCYGAAYLPWDVHAEGPVITRARGASGTSKPPECRTGDPKISAIITFYAPQGFTWDGGLELLEQVTFQNPTGAGTNGGRRGADFIINPPGDGDRYGTFTAGICGFTGFAGWSVNLSDAQGHRGNTVCLE